MVVGRWQLCRNHEDDYGWRVATEAISQSDAADGRRSAFSRSGIGGCGLRLEREPQGAVSFGQRHNFALPVDVKIRKLLFKMGDLGQVVDHDVGIVRMMNGIILVIGFRAIERLKRRNLRHDPS
jgi:hypothetical protein